MLRELEEAVKRRFRVASDGEEAEGLAETWESRLHISQVGKIDCGTSVALGSN